MDCGLAASADDIGWKIERILHFDKEGTYRIVAIARGAQAGLEKLTSLEDEFLDNG